MSKQNEAWFQTTPEAILRAESILNAFDENRVPDIAATLWQTAHGPHAMHLLVAMIAMANRLADYVAITNEATTASIVREAARVVAEGYYRTTRKDQE